MNRNARLRLPMTLSFVVVAAAGLAGPWLACDSSTGSGGSSSQSDSPICVLGDDAGPNQKCPSMPDPGKDCPPGCQIEVV